MYAVLNSFFQLSSLQACQVFTSSSDKMQKCSESLERIFPKEIKDGPCIMNLDKYLDVGTH